jgi:serine/threonine protein phosphatase PrpC
LIYLKFKLQKIIHILDTRERNMRVLASGSTDVGQIRQVNEDSIKLVNEHRLWILADGMGGHAAGQLASQMSVDEISHFLTATILKPNFKFPFDYEKQYTKEENLLNQQIFAFIIVRSRNLNTKAWGQQQLLCNKCQKIKF